MNWAMEANGSPVEWQLLCVALLVLFLAVGVLVARYRNRRPGE
jgi:hypothetical protein